MQLELDLYDGRNQVRHVRRLPRTSCESPFAAMGQIWHATRPADVFYSPDDAAAEQIKSGLAHFTLSVLVPMSSLWKAFVQQFADSVNRATNAFFLVHGRFHVFIEDGWPLQTPYYGPEGTLVKGDEGTWKPHLNMQSQGYGPPYEGWNGRDRSMGTQQGWFHRSDFDPFAVDESTQRLHVGRPGGTSGCRT